MRGRIIIMSVLLAGLAASCSGPVTSSGTAGTCPEIYPDYKDVTIPCNIAPLNFRLVDGVPEADSYAVEFKGFSGGRQFRFGTNEFRFPLKAWHALLDDSGERLEVTVMRCDRGVWTAYEPFRICVKQERIDPYVAYRLIDPGYEQWHHMGIYQRCLENFEQTAIAENSGTGKNCMNCHSFRDRDPEKMVFHMRGNNGGTYHVDGPTIEKLNTKTDRTISALVYPSWASGSDLVAFSVNDTWQSFHSSDANRIEVFDTASDVVVYDVREHALSSCDLLMSPDRFETSPTFSPDGRTLYFSSAPAVKDLPADHAEVKYSICAIPFDPETRSFGTVVDTLFNARTEGMSGSFPRISPDGRRLLFTRASYGYFHIWHKDADLYLIDLENGGCKALDGANSADVDSYHSWSGGSHWVVFSSRREDGLYTRLYFTYIDDEGNATKPFILPQEDTRYNHRHMQSYNIPEFISGPVRAKASEIADVARHSGGIDIKFAQ